MSKTPKYRDALISRQVAETYLTFIEELSQKFSTEFEQAALNQVMEHIQAHDQNMDSNQVMKIEATPQASEAKLKHIVLEGFAFLIQSCANGVPANLLLAARDDQDMQDGLKHIATKDEGHKFYELCDTKGLKSPEDILSKTDHGTNHFVHQEWANMKALTDAFLPASSLSTQLTQEIEKTMRELPRRTSVEKGFDFT